MCVCMHIEFISYLFKWYGIDMVKILIGLNLCCNEKWWGSIRLNSLPLIFDELN